MVEERLEFQLMLINEVRKRPALWDNRLPFFCSTALRTKQWQNVGTSLNITPDAASQTWEKIRKKYEKNRTQDSCFLSGKPARSLAKRWLFMDSLSFLDPVVTNDVNPTSLYSPTDACDSDVILTDEEYDPSLPSVNTVSLGSSSFNESSAIEYVPNSPEIVSAPPNNPDVEKLSSIVKNLQDASDMLKRMLEALQNQDDSVKVYAGHIASELKSIGDPGTLALAKYKIANVLYEAKISTLSSRK